MGMNCGQVTQHGVKNQKDEDWLKTNHGREPLDLLTTEILYMGKHNKFILENGGANCACCNGKRFREANYKDYPIWVVKYNCVKGEKYVVMSGKHRLNKAIADGESTIKSYVYTQAELEGYGDYHIPD
ncbi:hypothetical protein [uncultured phage MedDCM-OCT-S05-C139]|nr:hypothetical protein [uncultured phage MedDCM-OCT-S05-C139]